MLKAEYVQTEGWEAAVRGMRNPMNSWAMSDSEFEWLKLGERDLGLMKTLVSAGSDHGKFMRMIGISMDITAPLYWWKEYDTYKVGTVADSCSTMHKITAKCFEMDDFSTDGMIPATESALKLTLDVMNVMREMYLGTSDEAEKKTYWRQLILLLPTSYNQKRTVTLNYEVARRMYHARKSHKLTEWHELCGVFEGLPYAELITMQGKGCGND